MKKITSILLIALVALAIGLASSRAATAGAEIGQSGGIGAVGGDASPRYTVSGSKPSANPGQGKGGDIHNR